MNATQRQYIFGLILIGFSLYQLKLQDYLEFSLYATAGLAFVVNATTFESRLERFRKGLVILSWSLIIATGLLLLYLIQFKWF